MHVSAKAEIVHLQTLNWLKFNTFMTNFPVILPRWMVIIKYSLAMNMFLNDDIFLPFIFTLHQTAAWWIVSQDFSSRENLLSSLSCVNILFGSNFFGVSPSMCPECQSDPDRFQDGQSSPGGPGVRRETCCVQPELSLVTGSRDR